MKHSAIALYLLVLIHLIGLSLFVRKEINDEKPRLDYSNSLKILDSHTTLAGDPYLNLKFRNTASFYIDDISILVHIYGTNDTYMRTIEERLWTAYPPNEESFVSIKLGYNEDDLIEGATYKPVIISASKVD